MYIMGISSFQSDSSAGLLEDGRLIGAAEEERFVGVKHTGIFPFYSIDYLLKEAKITLKDVDHVAFFWKPFLDIHKRMLLILRHFPYTLKYLDDHGNIWKNLISTRRYMRKLYSLKKEPYKFHYIEHHFAHAASSFFLSDFEQSAILTIDGAGELTSTMFSKGKYNRIYPIKKINFPHSLGYLYASVTQYLGFKPNSGEGKVMGLSAYGKPTYYDKFRQIVKLEDEGGYKLDLSYFDYYKNAANPFNKRRWVSNKFIAEFGPMRKPESEISKRHEDIAASLQIVLNETALHMANFLYEVTKLPKLCIAGGVGLNSVMNGYLLENGPFEDIFIQPASNDAGAAIGAALYMHNCLLRKSRHYKNEIVYLGPEFSIEDIKKELNVRNSVYEYHKDIEKITANLIAKGNIVGWFQSKMEYGPRALGNRSILADPRRKDMKDILNMKVKHRESFRPFAPSILAEKSSEFFNNGYPSPLMLFVYDVLLEKRNSVPAITHIDGTGRIQTVRKDHNPLYWRLIKEFERITDVPLILNTSFNVRGKPIVRTPKDALDCFYSTGIDYLAIGNFLVKK